MQTIESAELKLPDRLLQTLGEGETIIVSDGTRPIAFLISAENLSSPRPFGLCKGEFEVPDDFNEPSAEIESLFYGES
jgi:antitoxin (DNA-binding transcriptional repressor) of toxin-antitoxin stability system